MYKRFFQLKYHSKNNTLSHLTLNSTFVEGVLSSQIYFSNKVNEYAILCRKHISCNYVWPSSLYCCPLYPVRSVTWLVKTWIPRRPFGMQPEDCVGIIEDWDLPELMVSLKLFSFLIEECDAISNYINSNCKTNNKGLWIYAPDMYGFFCVIETLNCVVWWLWEVSRRSWCIWLLPISDALLLFEEVMSSVEIDLDHPDFSNQKKFDNWVSKVGITFFFLLPKNGITQDTNLVIPISSLKERSKYEKNTLNKHGFKLSNIICLWNKCMYRTLILIFCNVCYFYKGK